MTFSIVCREPGSGALAVATATGMPAVGGFVPHVQAGVGAIATQGYSTNRLYGPDGLELLARGWSAQDVRGALIGRDRGRGWRQCLIVDAHGRCAAFTGDNNEPAFATKFGDQFVVAGNMLGDASVISAMAKKAGETAELDPVERILSVLEAGQAAGGDKRSASSSALLVEYPDGRRLDLRVDHAENPVAALRSLAVRMREPRVQAFVSRLPTRNEPSKA